MKKFFLAVFLFSAFIPSAQAAIHEETVVYKHKDVLLEGFLAFDDSVQEKRPGVVVVHDWMGMGEFNRDKARQLAQLGYVAFAIDMFGQDVRPKDSKEAAQQATVYKSDRKLMQERAKAGLDILKMHPLVKPDQMAAIGYCFGGTTVLEMARAGFPLAGVVSFHGGLETPHPEDASSIRAKVLVLHGADDPHVPPAEVQAFQKEMNDGNVDWQMIHYSGAVHSFTNPNAGADNSKGAAYNPQADRRSWQAMKQFFNEIFP